MEKISLQSILRIEEKINKTDMSKFARTEETKLIDKVLEIVKRASTFYSKGELEAAYQSYFLFVTLATFVFNKAKDKDYAKLMLRKEFEECMNKLEAIKDQCIKEEEELKKASMLEKARAELKSKQSDQPVRAPLTPLSGRYMNGTGPLNSVLKADDQYEPSTPAVQTSISCTELHEKIKSSRGPHVLLLIDCRPQAQFNAFSLSFNEDRLINVPPELNVKGLSAVKLGEKLSERHKTLWEKRSSFHTIVLFDEHSKVTPGGRDTSLERLLMMMNEFDLNTKYVSPPLLLEGGFYSWFCHYPFLTTNATLYKKSRLNEMETRLLHQTNLDDINYSYQFDSTPPEADLTPPTPESLLPPALAASVVPPPAISATQPTASDDVIADAPPLKPTIPLVDRSAKPIENHKGPSSHISNDIRSNKKDTSRPNNRTVSNDSDALTSRVEGLRFDDRGETFRPYASGLNRSTSFPNLSQMNGGDTLHEGRISSNVPEFDRTKKPSLVSHYDRRENSVAGTNVGPGLTGLKNLGNTCYINSILQCLSNTTPLRQFFQSEFRRSFTDSCRGNPRLGAGSYKLAEEFRVLFNMLWAGDTRYLSPNRFKEEVGKMKRTFRGCEQQDSHEFLTILIDSLHEDLKEPEHKTVLTGASVESGEKSWGEFLMRNKSIVSDLFYGQLKSTVICLTCQETSSTFEVFSNVSLPLPSHDQCSLRDCFDLYLKDEEIQGWHCPRCKTKRDARKKLDITKLPPILVLHFKRFTSDGWCRKKQTSVEFPETRLNMLEYTAANVESRDVRYDLYAVSNHYGTMESGHYTAYCRNKNKWYKFDDSDVTEISASKVKSPAAYILFYMSSRMEY